MNASKRIATILIGMSVLACQSKPAAEGTLYTTDSTSQIARKSQSVTDLEKQVLSTHDSVMPAMSELMKLKQEVTQHLAELDKQPASTDVRQRKQQGLSVQTALDQADQSMMNWMHHYNGDTLAKLDQQRALAYLKTEQQRVTAMSQLMRKSITDAQVYLKSR